jgi:hypothetical protein
MAEPPEPSWWDKLKERLWKMWEGGYVIPPPQPNSKRYLYHYRTIIVSEAGMLHSAKCMPGRP